MSHRSKRVELARFIRSSRPVLPAIEGQFPDLSRKQILKLLRYMIAEGTIKYDKKEGRFYQPETELQKELIADSNARGVSMLFLYGEIRGGAKVTGPDGPQTAEDIKQKVQSGKYASIQIAYQGPNRWNIRNWRRL